MTKNEKQDVDVSLRINVHIKVLIYPLNNCFIVLLFPGRGMSAEIRRNGAIVQTIFDLGDYNYDSAALKK